MKRYVFCLGIILASIPCFSQVTTTGGIVYYRMTANACPHLKVVTENNGHTFRVVPETGECSLGFPPPKAEWVFALGALTPGSYKVIYDPIDPYGPNPGILFTLTEESLSARTLSNFSRDESGRASFHVTGEEGVSYAIQRSTDLKAWADVGSVTGEADFTESAAASGEVAYYRVQVMAPEFKVNP